MNVGSLFSGVGGFDLGFERAGMHTAWFCECDPFCQRVLARHWPGVPCYPDVSELRGTDVERVDVLCGGFPCQDISSAGHKVGIGGARSGLWAEYARLIGELRPRYVVVENVPDLLGRGLGRVLGDLAEIGYDAEWDCIPASAFGAPHRRDRIWLVAYANGNGQPGMPVNARSGCGILVSGRPDDMGDASGIGRDATPDEGAGQHQGALGGSGGALGGSSWWATEPGVDRVVDGVPDGVDRVRSLGNALVPQIAEWIGRRIVAYEEGRLAA